MARVPSVLGTTRVWERDWTNGGGGEVGGAGDVQERAGLDGPGGPRIGRG